MFQNHNQTQKIYFYSVYWDVKLKYSELKLSIIPYLRKIREILATAQLYNVLFSNIYII